MIRAGFVPLIEGASRSISNLVSAHSFSILLISLQWSEEESSTLVHKLFLLAFQYVFNWKFNKRCSWHRRRPDTTADQWVSLPRLSHNAIRSLRTFRVSFSSERYRLCKLTFTQFVQVRNTSSPNLPLIPYKQPSPRRVSMGFPHRRRE